MYIHRPLIQNPPGALIKKKNIPISLTQLLEDYRPRKNWGKNWEELYIEESLKE